MEEHKLNFECYICFDKYEYDIEKDIKYDKQCETGLHYLCNECNEKWINECNRKKEDHICGICKSIIT